jgi:hypothetical protein
MKVLVCIIPATVVLVWFPETRIVEDDRCLNLMNGIWGPRDPVAVFLCFMMTSCK